MVGQRQHALSVWFRQKREQLGHQISERLRVDVFYPKGLRRIVHSDCVAASRRLAYRQLDRAENLHRLMSDLDQSINTKMKFNRWEAEFPILQFLKERNDAVHQDDIDIAISKVFSLNRLNPVVKANIKQEVNFALSRLQALYLVKRSGDGFARITKDGAGITKSALDALDKEYNRKEREARKQS
jgi:hypothetical protein